MKHPLDDNALSYHFHFSYVCNPWPFAFLFYVNEYIFPDNGALILVRQLLVSFNTMLYLRLKSSLVAGVLKLKLLLQQLDVLQKISKVKTLAHSIERSLHPSG